MSENNTPSYGNVLNNPLVTNNASVQYVDLTFEESASLSKLYPVNDALMNYWLGEAGDCFVNMANGIETRLNNMKMFTNNAANGTAESILNFNYADTEAGDSLTVDGTEEN